MRKQSFKVDPSFDIDGDGTVSQMDFFIATLFDKDKDGKLNPEERKACLDALHDGFEKKFLFMGNQSATDIH